MALFSPLAIPNWAVAIQSEILQCMLLLAWAFTYNIQKKFISNHHRKRKPDRVQDYAGFF